MKKILLLVIIFFLVSPLLGHEFWLEPEKFMYEPGDNINIRFRVGENFEGVNWTGNNEKVNTLQLYLDDITDDMADQVSDENGDSVQLSIFDEGTAIIAYNSNNSFIELDSAEFNSYLKEDGLTDAIDYRNSHHENDSAGTEWYQRSVKTLVQVGEKKTGISRQTNLPLDIIPLSNPYNSDDSLHIKILFKKQPLINQMVNVWQRVADSTYRKSYTTDDKGEFIFNLSATGKWMVSTVKMVHLENNPKAHWQSYWGSCTWGYQ